MEGESKRRKYCSVCRPSLNVNNDGGMSKPVVTMTPQDRIPSLSHFPVIVLYAYSVGSRGFRYSTTPSHVSKTVWSKSMTGVQAMSLLRKVKSGNIAGRLESKTLIDA